MGERLPKGTLGGQAVMEGVMMKGKDSYSVAIRRPDQKIEVTLEKYVATGDRHKIAKVPFIRGIVNFAEALVLGMKTLSYSSAFYEEEEEETKADKLFKDVFKEKAEGVMMGITILISVILAVGLFMLLPAGIAELLGTKLQNHYLLALIEGVVRLLIFILYVLLISQMQDIKRVFMYHGAEHKTINCYEAGDDLTPENVAKHSRYHKRCGTSFLFVVMIISILVFMFIVAEQMWLRFLLRLLLIPVIAGISYEFIRMAGRSDNAFFNILSKPGMWVQRLTTKEPDEEMIQVAIISVEAVLYGEEYKKAVNEAQGIGVSEKEDVTEENEEIEGYENTESGEEAEEYENAESDEEVEEFEETEAYEEVGENEATETYEEIEENEATETYEEVEENEETEVYDGAEEHKETEKRSDE